MRANYKDQAAPINLEWGRTNRTTGIRVPLSRGPVVARASRTVWPDWNCNPYIARGVSGLRLSRNDGEQKDPKPEF